MPVPAAAADPSGVLNRHFTNWCAKFKIFRTADGFETATGHVVYPAHAIREADGTVWLSALEGFEKSGIRGQVEKDASFLETLLAAANSPTRIPLGLALLIGGTRYQLVFQNSSETGGDHIINVAFINRGESPRP